MKLGGVGSMALEVTSTSRSSGRIGSSVGTVVFYEIRNESSL